MDNNSELRDSLMRQNSKSHPEVRQKNKNEFYTIQNSQPPPPNL